MFKSPVLPGYKDAIAPQRQRISHSNLMQGTECKQPIWCGMMPRIRESHMVRIATQQHSKHKSSGKARLAQG
eukprot:scaffold235026_cov18-Tisochrysis_lutea.AAC.1